MSIEQKNNKICIGSDIFVASVRCDETMIWITLTDGRVIGAPLAWSIRLSHATPLQRENWCIIGDGSGIEWEEIDEHISARVLMGHPS